MSHLDFVAALDKTTTDVVASAIMNCNPLPITRRKVLVGINVIRKNRNGRYDIIAIDKSILFKDILVFDVAVIVSKNINKENNVIRDVLKLERDYEKHANDISNYINCYKKAKEKNDYDRLAILEDKIQISECEITIAKSRISKFSK
jgi:hypothetical protein